VTAALSAIAEAAPDYLPAHSGARRELMPRIIDAVRARASVGEIADTLERVWGRYHPTN
jgi:methylmalonyl-CoA mutase N-terminal domain/subunit